jgi:hypothetical protein
LHGNGIKYLTVLGGGGGILAGWFFCRNSVFNRLQRDGVGNGLQKPVEGLQHVHQNGHPVDTNRHNPKGRKAKTAGRSIMKIWPKAAARRFAVITLLVNNPSIILNDTEIFLSIHPDCPA